MDPDLVRQQEEAELASRKGAAGMRDIEPARVFQAHLSHDQNSTLSASSQAEHEKTGASHDAKSATPPRFSPARAFAGSLAGFAAGSVAGAVLDFPILQILLLASALAILSGALAQMMFNRPPEVRS
jgi:hypothetical protein